MKISQTRNFNLVAKLNKCVHDLHSNLYPKYFKEYNYENVKEVFKCLVNNESFIFLLLEDNDEALGYAWIEIREYIHQISIVETKRNKGYGSSLMECI